jgi:PAS domain S-box-containing protein
LNSIYKKSPFGYAHHEIILDSNGVPYDYKYVDINQSFEDITGISIRNIIGKTAREVIPGLEYSKFNWIEFYGKIALNYGNESIEQYQENLNKWFKVHVFSEKLGFFTTIFTDITPFIKIQTDFQTNKYLYESLLSNIDAIQIKLNPGLERKIIYSTKQFENLTNYSLTEIETFFDLNYLNLIIEKDRQYVLSTINLNIQSNSPWNIRYQIKLKNGSLKWIQERGSAITNANGNVEYINCVLHNIDELIYAEQKANFNSKLKSIISKSLHKLNSLNDDISFNSTVESLLKDICLLFKLDRSYIFQINANQTITIKNEWCSEGVPSLKNIIKNISIKNFPWLSKFFLNKQILHVPDVSELPNSAKIEKTSMIDLSIKSFIFLPTIGSNGQLSGYFGIDSIQKHYSWDKDEISLLEVMAGIIGSTIERRRAEKEALTLNQSLLAQSQQIAHIGSWMLNIKSNQLIWSDETYRIFGLNPQEFPATYEAFIDAVHPEDREKVNQAYLDSIEFKKNSYEIEHRIIKKNSNEIRFVYEKCIHKRDENGEITLSIGMVQDITEKKEAEDALHLKNVAEIANKAKSDFLAIMSHEIRTPLNSVIGFTNLLLDTKLNSIQKEYSLNINNASKTLLNLINNILDLSKIESGAMEVEYIKVDLLEIYDQISNLFKYIVNNKKLELIIDIPNTIPNVIEIDRVKLQQIILNLTANAIKFTECGEIILSIHFTPLSNSIGNYLFVIQDTGIGMSNEQIEKLFKPFSQASPSTSRRYGGTGLGLTISKLLVEKLGGSIQIQSEINKGTTFSFELNLQHEPNVSLMNIDLNQSLLIYAVNKKKISIMNKNLQQCGLKPNIHNNIDIFFNELSHKKFDSVLIDFTYFDENKKDIFNKLEKFQSNYNRLIFTDIFFDYEFVNTKSPSKKIYYISNPINFQKLYDLLINKIPDQSNANLKETSQYSDQTNKIFFNRNVSILITEDEEMNMILLKSILKRYFKTITFFESKSGLQTIEILKNSDSDLIFMDLNLPEMDGFETTKLIRNNPKYNHIPIVGLSASALIEEKEKSINLGMNDFITKPINIDELEFILTKYFNH